MTKRYLIAATIAAAFTLSGCFNGSSSPSGGSNPPPPPPSPSGLTVNAGEDKTVTEGASVTLLGIATDSNGQVAKLLWEHVSDNPITIQDSDKAIASFTAPNVTAATTLTFRLTATDNDDNTAADEVEIRVTDSAPPPPEDGLTKRTRYEHNNMCFAMLSIETEKFVTDNNGSYTATADDITNAEKFWMRPAALGKYIIYNPARELLTADGALARTPLDDASPETAVFTLTAAGDTTTYPDTPAYHQEPTLEYINLYRNFAKNLEPNIESSAFTITLGTNRITVDGAGALTLAAAEGTNAEQFHFQEIATEDCAEFPEATSNTTGDTFSGTQANGHVLGHADVHVHISSSNFLGMAQWGSNFHQLGVTHALDDCVEFHGQEGEKDVVGTVFGFDTSPDLEPPSGVPSEEPFGITHNTTGWPTFPQWPARGELFHEAIYWGWLERAWKGGLRIIVNDLVDNETLCELQRGLSPDPLQDCNAMNNAGRQVGSMYALQDYIDAQYGGRGDGWYQISLDPDEARANIEDGKAAVILGIEISNFLDCKVNYSPLRTQEPYQEDGSGGIENSWDCSMDPNDGDKYVGNQLDRLWDLGVRQIVSIHEFDNALGGNGIFDGLVLNAGNRENSGGLPVGGVDLIAAITNGEVSDPFTGQAALEDLGNSLINSGTGEFWTTYECPQEGDESDFKGYFSGGGENMPVVPAESPIQCHTPFPGFPQTFTGQGGRPGGALPCYPTAKQCNARLMTPIGLYVYARMMEKGFIFDVDHMEIGMKTQALTLAEAQDPPYPFVSTHGSFGGITEDQAERMYRNGGYIFPSLGGASSFKSDVNQRRAVWEAAADSEHRVDVFGIGYGTDTNGLSGQAGRRNGDARSKRPVTYPFELFNNNDVFADLAGQFANTPSVTFNQPGVHDAALNEGRTWHIDEDGSAQYGLLADFVEELNVEANATLAEPNPEHQQYKDALAALFNSAEAYLQTWEKTNTSRDEILKRGGILDTNLRSRILRPAARPQTVSDANDLDNPDINHFDKWGTDEDPYEPNRPPSE